MKTTRGPSSGGPGWDEVEGEALLRALLAALRCLARLLRAAQHSAPPMSTACTLLPYASCSQGRVLPAGPLCCFFAVAHSRAAGVVLSAILAAVAQSCCCAILPLPIPVAPK